MHMCKNYLYQPTMSVWNTATRLSLRHFPVSSTRKLITYLCVDNEVHLKTQGKTVQHIWVFCRKQNFPINHPGIRNYFRILESNKWSIDIQFHIKGQKTKRTTNDPLLPLKKIERKNLQLILFDLLSKVDVACQNKELLFIGITMNCTRMIIYFGFKVKNWGFVVKDYQPFVLKPWLLWLCFFSSLRIYKGQLFYFHIFNLICNSFLFLSVSVIRTSTKTAENTTLNGYSIV